ncbi:MAG: Undecaprenyl-phosphate 4-deoxy-4-formamido-L-arabinose transferase [Acidobacteriota bacterium]|jgi:glycosyltransferase involved in cell wall biosynthesis
MAEPQNVTIVVPAFNERESIAAVVTSLLAAAPWREVLVVDDGSTDGTGTAAAAAGARVVTHPYNKGNGAAVKSAIRAATGEWLVVVDGDGQHRAADVTRLIARLGDYDLVIGARSADSQATTGRRIGNAVLNGLATYLTERPIPDLTSGFRAARREFLLEFIHLLPNGFSTPTTTTLAFIKAGYNVAFEPVGALPRVGTSKIRLASDGAKFLLILLKVITIFSPVRIFAPVGAAAFALGSGYGLWNFAYHDRIPNGAVLLLMFSVIVMLVGLVSEQIASLRFEGRR